MVGIIWKSYLALLSIWVEDIIWRLCIPYSNSCVSVEEDDDDEEEDGDDVEEGFVIEKGDVGKGNDNNVSGMIM